MANQISNNSIGSKDKKINELIKRKVIEVMREIVSDPEYNLELNPSAAKRLKKSVSSQKKGKVVNLDKVLEKYM